MLLVRVSPCPRLQAHPDTHHWWLLGHRKWVIPVCICGLELTLLASSVTVRHLTFHTPLILKDPVPTKQQFVYTTSSFFSFMLTNFITSQVSQQLLLSVYTWQSGLTWVSWQHIHLLFSSWCLYRFGYLAAVFRILYMYVYVCVWACIQYVCVDVKLLSINNILELICHLESKRLALPHVSFMVTPITTPHSYSS